MTINSLSFIFFFISVLIVYHVLSDQYKWIVALLASICFYSLFSYHGVIILLASTFVDHLLSLKILTSPSRYKKVILIFGIAINIALIFIFKYLNLFNETAVWLINGIFTDALSYQPLNLVAPAGISFITFKKISYLIDCYRSGDVVEKNYFRYLTYVANFLQILSGPIDRAGTQIPQLRSPARIDICDWQRAFILILTGFFMKLVIADRLSIYTDAVFDNVDHHYGMTLVVAAYFYAFQIYADFAGYTNVALGCGYLMGLKFHPNFNLPYFSDSISSFWRRWHMTLSYWFRDYLYIPLGGNRVSPARRVSNVMVIFFLTGLWHGANWTFMVWGLIHGVCISWEVNTQKLRDRLYDGFNIPARLKKVIRIVITFHLVCAAWIFFRASSIDDAVVYFKHIVIQPQTLFVDSSSMAYGLMGIGVLVVTEYLQYTQRLTYEKFEHYSLPIKYGLVYLLIFSIVLCGVGSESAFIYYQF